jgi:4-carboxymuconolactone decarboxylase
MPPDDDAVRLARLAAVVAVSDETRIRSELAAAAGSINPDWVEEMILQSYLFAGFPRALNAAREWRRVSRVSAPPTDPESSIDRVEEWKSRGEQTCAVVYGEFYGRLRHNIATLHPALDSWMIVEGYGKVLSRPGLPLSARELCIVAVCAAARQDRQLHSHLHGALNAGATPEAVDSTLDVVSDLLSDDDRKRYRLLWNRVLQSRSAGTEVS